MKKITTPLYAALVLGVVLFACKKKNTDDTNKLPAINGYNNAGEVAPSNLLAYWSFDDVTKESKSGVDAATKVRNTFVTGIKGKALALDTGYLVYPAITGIQSGTSMPSWTISCWVNLKNTGNSFTQILTVAPSVANADDIWGNLQLCAETGWFPAASDTLVPKIFMRPMINNAPSGQDNRPDPKGNPPVGVFKQAGKWCHLVGIWDQSTSKLQLYGNGELISNTAWENRTANGNPIGATTFKANDAFIIGSMLCKELGYTAQGTRQSWSKWLSGNVDELRIFSKALSPTEISSLYQLEKAGR